MTQNPRNPESAVKPRLTNNRRRKVVENDDFAAFARRVIRAFSKRIANGDIDALADIAFMSGQIDQAIKDAVTGLRQRGYSWTDIGLQLGVTKQAAQQRYGGDSR